MFGLGFTSKLKDRIADLESTIYYLRNMNDYFRRENAFLRTELRKYTTECDQTKQPVPTAPASRVVCGTMEPADTGIESIMTAALTYHIMSDTDSNHTYDSGSLYDSNDYYDSSDSSSYGDD